MAISQKSADFFLRSRMADAENGDVDALYDLGVNYETRRFGKFTLGIENLLDKQYILAWAQIPGFQNYWAGRGRMVSLTHTFNF